MSSQVSFKKTVSGLKLTNQEFQKVRAMVHKYCGIAINEGKEALVQSRLMKRVRKTGVRSFGEYFAYLEQDSSGAEFLALIDVITTNKTSFFRESKHFEFIENQVLPKMAGRDVKWWSAGCSSGEEPITTAITLLEGKKQNQWSSVKILATDISRDVIKIAKQGIYPETRMGDVPDLIKKNYFNTNGKGEYQISKEIRNMITYGRLNLSTDWPMKGPFHVIMCRNVMIYFNRQSQIEIVERFYRLLEPGGYLFLGHSEGVPKEVNGFKGLAPAVYQKVG
ncbi:CheR family methyltransferase [Gracilimonas sp. Q87]|uniref:CheR family methyltransferase n=1 Tax=Gracilimonas sp. Q87 TaxID=3384766 RepID=UPI0039842514